MMKKRWITIFLGGLPGLFMAGLAVLYLFPGFVLSLAVRADRTAAGLEERTVQAAEHRIQYLSGGSGETLVLLHGFAANKDNWTRVAAYLTPHFRVIAPDLPGFGESSRDAQARYAVSDQVERLHAFARALGLARFHLGGNSMGGWIAGAYAAGYPRQVQSLWLLAPGGVASAQASELAQHLAQGENPLIVNRPEDFDTMFEFAAVIRPWIPGPIKRYLAEQAMRQRDFNAKVVRDLAETPLSLEPLLQDHPVPALIVWGEQDRILHVSGAAILAGLMPNAQAVVMPHTGHIPMIERPQETAERFLRFQHIDF